MYAVTADEGICDTWGPVAKISEAGLLTHFVANTPWTLWLFKTTTLLLGASEKPKMVCTFLRA
ncbi:hypothetical protein V8C37DRAFT_391445 [Trichoderma ceciliae]